MILSRRPPTPRAGADHAPTPRPSLVALAALALSVAAACGDSSGPGDSSGRPLTVLELPAGDTVYGRGVEFVLRYPKGPPDDAFAVVLDPGTPAERVDTVNRYGPNSWAVPGDTSLFEMRLSVHAGTGRHSFVVRTLAGEGHALESAPFTRVFRVDDAPYRVLELRGPAGEAADAWGLNDRGDVAGAVAPATATARPILWRGGTPAVIDTGAPVVGAARRINEAGQIAIGGASAMPVTILVTPGQPTRVGAGFLRDLNDRGVAVVDSSSNLALLDAASGTRTAICTRGDVMEMCHSPVLGNAGQAVFVLTDLQARTSEQRIVGSVPYVLPPRRSRIGMRTRVAVQAIGDAGEVLLSYAYEQLGISLGSGVAVNIDQLLGGAVAVMSRRGGHVVALGGTQAFAPASGTDGALYLWRTSDRRTRRVAGEATSWDFQEVRAVNATGAILAVGRERASGRTATLLLTPTP